MHKTLILVAAIAIPAAAHSAFAPSRESPCFTSGAATYQIARDAAAPDYRIKVAVGAAHPDLRMQVVDRPEVADFVLVDDFSGSPQPPCRSATPIRTVSVDAAAASPDVTVALSADGSAADYKIYVHSVRFSQQDAAALLAAMWKADRKRRFASAQTDGLR